MPVGRREPMTTRSAPNASAAATIAAGDAVIDHGLASCPHAVSTQLFDGPIDDGMRLSLWLHDRHALDCDHVLDVQGQHLGAGPGRNCAGLRHRLVARRGAIDGNQNLSGRAQGHVRSPDDKHRDVDAGGNQDRSVHQRYL